MGGDFEDTCLGKTGVYGIGRAEQLQRRAHAGRRQVFGFNLRCADDEDVLGLGCDVNRVARMYQARWALQRHARCVDANHLAAHAAQCWPLRACTEATAVQQPFIGIEADVCWVFGAIPVHGDTQLLHLVRQRGQQLAVVQLAFAGQVHALGKALRQRRFDLGHAGAVEHLHRRQVGQGGAGFF